MDTYDDLVGQYLGSVDAITMSGFLRLKSELSDRANRLVLALRETTFLIDPASSKHHLNCIGGLAKHCHYVYAYLRDQKIEEEQAFILAFCHDLCKLELYEGKVISGWKAYTDEEREQYLIENGSYPKNKGYTREYLSYSVNDQFPIGHGDKSCIIALQWGIPLTTNELLAIRWHMEQDDREYQRYRKAAMKRARRLIRALQIADQEATLDEEGL